MGKKSICKPSWPVRHEGKGQRQERACARLPRCHGAASCRGAALRRCSAVCVCFAVPNLPLPLNREIWLPQNFMCAQLAHFVFATSLPSVGENVSATGFPVVLALVRLFLCVPLPAAPSTQARGAWSCRVPAGHTVCGAAQRLLPSLLALEKVRTPSCFSLGDRHESVSLFSYQLLLLAELVELSGTQPHPPLTNRAGISELVRGAMTMQQDVN